MSKEAPSADPSFGLLLAAKRLRSIINDHVSLADIDAFDQAIAICERARILPKYLAYSIYRDGAAWCAVASDFINLQESLAGFGESPVVALGELIVEEQAIELARWKEIRQWKCNNCQNIFHRRWNSDGRTDGTGAPCPRCSCGGQYTYEVLS